MRRLQLASVILLLLLFFAACYSAGRLTEDVPAPSVHESLASPPDRADAASTIAPAGSMPVAAGTPLGVLSPTPNLLPSGTTSVTLTLTTTAPSRCRWSEVANTRYNQMPNDFEQGQEMSVHSTSVTGLRDLDDRYFYVRCEDLAGDRDPDADESRTHLRVLGPWNGGYPRLANMYGSFDRELAQLFAGYDLYIPYQLRDAVTEAIAIRRINPNAKVLRLQNATYGWPDLDPLTTEWWNSRPGDPGYICLLRDSSQQILTVEGWGHPMYNLTEPYCRSVLVQKNIDEFLSPAAGLGADLAYDGIFWDGFGGRISWLSSDIDSDLDGYADAPGVLDAAYQAGEKELLAQMRASLPHVLLLGGVPPEYTRWLNGRVYETDLPSLLDGADGWIWDVTVADYRDWTRRGRPPHITILFGAPEAIYRQKHSSESEPHVLPAFQAEAASSYRHMRFGLVSALMGDGLFLFDLGEVDRPPAWYDEFGALGGSSASTLPPSGYLGKPIGEPHLLADELDTPDQIVNGDFEDGLINWNLWVNSGAGAAATVGIDPHGGISGSAAVHLSITNAAAPWDVLLSQYGGTTLAGQSYTLSFWARSEVTRTLAVSIAKQDPPGTNYGFRFDALVTPEWRHFHLWDAATVTANDSQLVFASGDTTGELWLDHVQFQAGALGVWVRPFENGLAVINTTGEVQTVALPGGYCKLRGGQAPLFEARLDDNEAQASAGWDGEMANREQFGTTVHVAPGGSADTMTYEPALAYGGEYEVLVWVAPKPTQSNAVSVSVRHANGESIVLLDETAGPVGWHTLGKYPFSAGRSGSATLKSTGNGTVVADAVKWVSTARYNDGTQVGQVRLQPQDGIVLLSSCWKPVAQIYLPAIRRN